VPLHDNNIWPGAQLPPIEFLGVTSFDGPVSSTNYLKMLKSFLAQGFKDSRLPKMLFLARWDESSQSGPGLNMVNRAIWRKIDCQERVAASVTGLQSMRLFFVNYLKQRVYNPLPKTFEDLRFHLTREIENIPAQILKNNFLNFRKRCELLISAGGGHIEKK
jgi:hypothetical protein